MKIVKEFREFAVKGNAFDLAVGVIIGAAFGKIVTSLVEDIIMPPISFLLGSADFSNRFWVLRGTVPAGSTLADAKAAGALTFNYGKFGNTILEFIIVAFAVFLLVKQINRIKRRNEAGKMPTPDKRPCPECLSEIPIKATRCAHCATPVQPMASSPASKA